MSKTISIKGTLSKNVNKTFRLKSKIFHIIQRPTTLCKIPVIINNFNRLDYLHQQLDWLYDTGFINIYIIDNHSTYSPLFEFYNKTKATVFLLDKNVGHEAMWRTHIYQRFMNGYYVYTDPDVLPADDTPKDFMDYFMDVLNRYPEIDKVGFGLKTDDLPDHYPKKAEVINWENSLLNNEIAPGLFKAKIDTTFALYRPKKSFQCWETTIRTGAPYLLRHLPWYEDPGHLSEESKYYLDRASDASSWYKAVVGENIQYEK